MNENCEKIIIQLLNHIIYYVNDLSIEQQNNIISAYGISNALRLHNAIYKDFMGLSDSEIYNEMYIGYKHIVIYIM